MSFQRSFVHAVRHLCEERGITPDDFGARAGLDWRILAGMERGFDMYLANIEQIAKALRIPPSELVRLASVS